MADNLTLLRLITQRGISEFGDSEWRLMAAGKSVVEQNRLLPPHLMVRWAGFKLQNGWKR